jgi:hypothetical protein
VPIAQQWLTRKRNAPEARKRENNKNHYSQWLGSLRPGCYANDGQARGSRGRNTKAGLLASSSKSAHKDAIFLSISAPISLAHDFDFLREGHDFLKVVLRTIKALGAG